MKILKNALCVVAIVFAMSLLSVSKVNAQEENGSDTITVYKVEKGDTIGEIAEKFGITTNTILWANDLERNSKIKIGQKLVILPVSGVQYIVKAGDAVESIARRFKADKNEIADHNNLDKPYLIKVGEILIIPDGKPNQVATTNNVKKVVDTVVKTTKDLGQKVVSFLATPVEAATRTQGLHGNNGVDLAADEETPILAAADGEVVISQTGWNGGYGTYIVINHSNGTQTLYAHNNENLVSVGDTVTQGQVIAHMGSTGKSTGDHVHFEVRGAKNPF